MEFTVSLVDTRNDKVISSQWFEKGDDLFIEEWKECALELAKERLEEEADETFGYRSNKHYSEFTLEEGANESMREDYLANEIKEFKFFTEISI